MTKVSRDEFQEVILAAQQAERDMGIAHIGNIEEEKEMSKAAVKKAPKVKAVKEVKAPVVKEVKVVDVSTYLKDLPAIVRPKDICSLFGYEDGGKTVRRTLRAKFAGGHDHKASWEWSKDDPILATIISHFAQPKSEKKVAVQ